MLNLLLVDPKTSCYYSIKPAVVSESLAHSRMHVTNPQDTANLASSYFPPVDFDQIPVLPTRVHRETGPFEFEIPFQYPFEFEVPFHYDLEFNNRSRSEDNILSEFLPPSSSTGSLSMECDVHPYQLQQSLDPNTQIIPQPISPYASNTSPGNSHSDIYAETTGSSEYHLMTSANDRTTLPFPKYDANYPHSYYM